MLCIQRRQIAKVVAKGRMHTYAKISAQHKRSEQSQPFQGVKEEVNNVDPH